MPTDITLVRNQKPDENNFDQKLLERLQDIIAGRNKRPLPTQTTESRHIIRHMIDSSNNFWFVQDNRTPTAYTLRTRWNCPDNELHLKAAEAIICAEWPAIFEPSSPTQHFALNNPAATRPLGLWLPSEKNRRADTGDVLVARLQDILVGRDKANPTASLKQSEQSLDTDARFYLFQDPKNPNHYTVAVQAGDQSAQKILQAAQAIMQNEFPQYTQPKQSPIRRLLSSVLKLG